MIKIFISAVILTFCCSCQEHQKATIPMQSNGPSHFSGQEAFDDFVKTFNEGDSAGVLQRTLKVSKGEIKKILNTYSPLKSYQIKFIPMKNDGTYGKTEFMNTELYPVQVLKNGKEIEQRVATFYPNEAHEFKLSAFPKVLE